MSEEGKDEGVTRRFLRFVPISILLALAGCGGNQRQACTVKSGTAYARQDLAAWASETRPLPPADVKMVLSPTGPGKFWAVGSTPDGERLGFAPVGCDGRGWRLLDSWQT